MVYLDHFVVLAICHLLNKVHNAFGSMTTALVVYIPPYTRAQDGNLAT